MYLLNNKAGNIRITFNIESLSWNHCCNGKAINITYWVRVCSFMYPACKAHGAHSQSMACPALKYFSTLSHKWNGFREKLLNLKCVFWFSLQVLSETFLILRRTELDMIKHEYRSSRKTFLSKFNENWTSLTDIRNIFKYKISRKSLRWEPNSSKRADRRTDTTKLLRRFSQFCEGAWKLHIGLRRIQILLNSLILNMEVLHSAET
jgi:hypothetical protein